MPAPRLLLTRPAAASARFAADVAAALGRVPGTVISPLMEIVATGTVPAGIPAALVLTSENGAAQLSRLGLPPGLPAWCVGPRTASAARRAGAQPVAVEADAAGLVAAILRQQPVGPILHVRGEHARGDISAQLRSAGIDAADCVAYRQDALLLTAEARALLAEPGSVVLPLFSPRSVSILAKQGPFLASLTVVALSPAVADEARVLAPAQLTLAEGPTGAAMLSATVSALTLELAAVERGSGALEGPEEAG